MKKRIAYQDLCLCGAALLMVVGAIVFPFLFEGVKPLHSLREFCEAMLKSPMGWAGMALIVVVSTLLVISGQPRKEVEQGYAFRKKGDKWKVTFEGRACYFNDRVGMSYIARLLAKRNREVSTVRLCQAPNGRPARNVKSAKFSERVVDEEYMRTCEESLQELRLELEQAKKNGDLASEHRIQGEIGKIENELRSDKGLGDRFRRFTNDQERARVAVTQAISRALASIKEEHPELWQHLKRSIRTGATCSYRPDQDFNWEL